MLEDTIAISEVTLKPFEARTMMDNIFVSVVIPVFNDAQRLKKCLSALEQQTYAKVSYEVIVVDNGSTESLDTIVSQFPQALLTNESQTGSYAARNQGLSLAKGEIIAFTDSDCIPAFDWIETGVKNLLSEPKCGLVAGKIEIFFNNPNHPTLVELYDSVTFLQQKNNIENENYGTTANLFTFKSVMEDVGNFNSQLKSGGDFEWGRRVFARGYLQLYADDCCVAHPARDSFAQIYKKVIRVKGGCHDFDTFNSKEDTKNFFKNLIKDLSALRPPIRSSCRSVVSDKRIDIIRKPQIFCLKIIIHYLVFWEEKRLQLGGTSSRE